MEREKPPYIPPMNGQEVFDMFGNRQLLALEEQHKRHTEQMEVLKTQLNAAHENPDTDWEDIHRMEVELQLVREAMREHDRLIRKSAQDFGNKRGPVTLH